MYPVAKILFDEKCRFKAKDFEDAQKLISAKFKIKFKEFIYHDTTNKVLTVCGLILHPVFGRIRVEWNYEGKAFIANEPFPEFNINVQQTDKQVSR